jgi:predicted pyridoxine 5'-phosphate oxidase superfamily flavin-nucleotide-binding protein
MSKVFPEIDAALRSFIEAQKMFFVATAPAGEGHINLSPKGLEMLRVLDARSVAYLDFVGSGAETIAHLRENGRIAIMVCAFTGAPRILRLQGRGEVIEPGDADYAELRARFSPGPARCVIRATMTRIADSCGWGVPIYRHEGERTQLQAWMEKKGEQGLSDYQHEKNAFSIDGLPALRWTDEC